MRGFFRVPVLALLLVASAVGAAPPEPPIRVPAAPVVQPAPGAAVRLTADVLYVVDSDVPFLAFGSPGNVLRITKESGPLRVRGKFVDGDGTVQTRTYKGKYLAVVEPGEKGRAELIVLPTGAKDESEAIRRTIEVTDGTGPQPPPKPDPKPEPPPVPPKPDPKPDPAPKVDSVWVIVVEDATASRTVETAKALNDPFWRTLKPKHDWRHYLSDSKVAVDNGYVERAKTVGYPAVLILDAKDGDPLRVFKLTTAAAVDAELKGVVK